MKNSFLPFILSSLLILAVSFPSKAIASNLINDWTITSNLPDQRASSTSFSVGNEIFVLGGSAALGVNSPKPVRSSINLDGSLVSWLSDSAALPKGMIWHSTVLKGNYVYVIGGNDNVFGSSSNNLVYKGEISNGLISSWTLVNSLPIKSALGNAAVVSNRVYYAGGKDESNLLSNKLFFADIETDGTIGPWNVSGNLVEPLEGFGMVSKENAIYIIGGKTPNGVTSAVRKALLNPDGTIQAWITMSPLPEPIYRAGVNISGKYIISAGGINNNGTYLKEIYYSEINDEGSLENWSENSVELPTKNCCFSLGAMNNYLYIIGGHDGVGYFDTVYYTKVNPGTTDPSTIDLAVPLLKQTSEPWQGNIYDSANKWSPSTPTINRWGCALTSTAMVMNYYGLSKITETTDLTPGTLNTWLVNEPDGYIGNGLLNWLAVSRLSKKIAPINESFDFDALEFTKVRQMDNQTLDEDLTHSHPTILEVPGHFVVAKGKTTDSYNINDPFYNRTSLDAYANQYRSLNRYIPSNTDLSYIMVTSSPDVEVTIRNAAGEVVGESYIQEPITNPIELTKSGKALKIVYLPKPSENNYTLTFASENEQSFAATSYLYDNTGNVTIHKHSGFVSTTNDDSYDVDFSHETAENSTVAHPITFEDIQDDLQVVENSGLVNRAIATIFRVALKDVQSEYDKGKRDHAIEKLNTFKDVIMKLPRKDTDEDVLTILLDELDSLKLFLQENQ